MAAATNPSDFELKLRMFRRVTTKSASPVMATEGVAETAKSTPAGMDGMTAGGSFDFLGQ
jgi:hypothetical protein